MSTLALKQNSMKQVILLFTLLIAIGNYGANAQVSPARFAVEFNAGVPLMLEIGRSAC